MLTRCVLLAWLLLPVLTQGAQSMRLSLQPDDPISATAFSIVSEAYRRLGYNPQAVLLPAERALSSAAQGQTDADTVRAAGIEKRYPQLLAVPVVLLQVESYAFTTGRDLTLNSWDDLRPYRLCVRFGIKLLLEKTAGLDRVFSGSVPHTVQLLRAGRCNVAILSQMAWLDIDALHAGPLRQSSVPLAVTPLYHYLHQRHRALLPKLSRVLRDMQREGRIAAIVATMQAKVDAARARQSFADSNSQVP